MIETYKDLLIGITGGIIATGIVGFVIVVFNKIVWPKIRKLTYRGIDLDDEWNCTEYETIKEGDETKNVKAREYQMTIKQNGHRIKGDITIKNICYEDYMSFYKTKGIVKDNYVQIDF